MKWIVHSERSIYRSDWVCLSLADVELPSGPRLEHHVVRMPAQAAGVVIDDPGRGVLLLWRHRFITDSWGWEIPGGRIDSGESPIEAAERETVEETGWCPGALSPLVRYFPINGLSDQTFHVFTATAATHVGDPTEPDEAEKIRWMRWPEIRRAITNGEIRDGMSLTALLHRMATR